MTELTSKTLSPERKAADRLATARRRRLFWMQQARQWHWISSALCLIGLLLFAGTGITLNHASQIEAKPKVVTQHAQLPAPLVAGLAGAPEEGKTALPETIRDWVGEALKIDLNGHLAEWSADEAYVALPRPGGDAWLSIDRTSGAVEYETTTRGVIALLNDLHKGRNTGVVWAWFIDIFAGACVVFSLTGLLLLQLHARGRPITWPLVGAGLVIPLLLAVLFMHL